MHLATVAGWKKKVPAKGGRRAKGFKFLQPFNKRPEATFQILAERAQCVPKEH